MNAYIGDGRREVVVAPMEAMDCTVTTISRVTSALRGIDKEFDVNREAS